MQRRRRLADDLAVLPVAHLAQVDADEPRDTPPFVGDLHQMRTGRNPADGGAAVGAGVDELDARAPPLRGHAQHIDRRADRAFAGEREIGELDADRRERRARRMRQRELGRRSTIVATTPPCTAPSEFST